MERMMMALGSTMKLLTALTAACALALPSAAIAAEPIYLTCEGGFELVVDAEEATVSVHRTAVFDDSGVPTRKFLAKMDATFGPEEVTFSRGNRVIRISYTLSRTDLTLTRRLDDDPPTSYACNLAEPPAERIF